MMSATPNLSLPRLWCDFNACGWSGQAGDDCFYAFDQQALAALSPAEGMRLLIHDDDGDGEVLGCEGQLEAYAAGWRIRPDERTWLQGRLPATAD